MAEQRQIPDHWFPRHPIEKNKMVCKSKGKILDLEFKSIPVMSPIHLYGKQKNSF